MQGLSVAAPFARGRSNHRRWRLSALASLLIVAGAGTALAQTGPGNAAQPNTTASHKHGVGTMRVIKPKGNVDPHMAKVPPAHGAGTMRVIKPKGTHDGPPGLTPK